MKKLTAFLLLLLSTSGIVFAHSSKGGFYDENSLARKTTVREALKLQDNSYVTLKGNITKRISGDTYLFEDSTGTITIEIDANKWMGQIANKKDYLEISGEIERNFNAVKIDVDNVRKLPK